MTLVSPKNTATNWLGDVYTKFSALPKTRRGDHPPSSRYAPEPGFSLALFRRSRMFQSGIQRLLFKRYKHCYRLSSKPLVLRLAASGGDDFFRCLTLRSKSVICSTPPRLPGMGLSRDPGLCFAPRPLVFPVCRRAGETMGDRTFATYNLLTDPYQLTTN